MFLRNLCFECVSVSDTGCILFSVFVFMRVLSSQVLCDSKLTKFRIQNAFDYAQKAFAFSGRAYL